MTDITQNADTYPPAIYQISVTDPVLGGAGGIANKAAAALADRTAYQRMRNVTPWVPGLDQPYPAHAYVQRLGLTYKSLVGNANVDPATPAALNIWERWAYTESEMYAFLKNNHGGNCPVTGPAAAPSAAAPWTMYTSVAPYLEVWMWVPVLGWRVIANRYRVQRSAITSVTGAASVVVITDTVTMPRAGKIVATSIGLGDAAYSQYQQVRTGIAYNGVAYTNPGSVPGAGTGGAYVGAPLTLPMAVNAGDVVSSTFQSSTATVGYVSQLLYQYVD